MFNDLSTHERAAYPELAKLALGPRDWEALRCQGFVSRESRGLKFTAFKLRFRLGGRQRVVYLGTDHVVAERVALELASLQQEIRRTRQLRAELKAVRRAVRALQRKSGPVLEPCGLRYHGRVLRKTRRIDEGR